MPQSYLTSDLTQEVHWERHMMVAASSQERIEWGWGGRLYVGLGGWEQSFPGWLGIGSILWPDLGFFSLQNRAWMLTLLVLRVVLGWGLASCSP